MLTVVSMGRRPQDQLDSAQLDPLRDLAIQGADPNPRHPSWGDNVTNVLCRTLNDIWLVALTWR